MYTLKKRVLISLKPRYSEAMPTVRKDTAETQRQLIDAAERLFAERGVDNVSLLDIGREAGQKNRNAPQYHFGDKTRLINAVLDKHGDDIASRRATRVAALESTEEPKLSAVVAAFVLPVAEHAAAHPNSLAFLQINAQMMTSPTLTSIARERSEAMPEVRALSRLFAKVAPRVPTPEREAKLLLIQSMLHHGLASYHGQHPGADNRRFTAVLCASIEAVMSLDHAGSTRR